MKLVLDLNTENIYLIVIGILLVTQVYQFYIIQRTKKELGSVWAQISLMAISVGAKLMELEKSQTDEKK